MGAAVTAGVPRSPDAGSSLPGEGGPCTGVGPQSSSSDWLSSSDSEAKSSSSSAMAQ